MDVGLKVSGHIKATFCDSASGEVWEVEHHNLVTRYGLEFIAGCIARTEARTIAQMGIGRSAQAPSTNDAWLMSEIARSACTISSRGSVVTINATFGEDTGAATISELALFGSDGTAFTRSVVPSQNKTSTTTVQVQWTLTLQSA